ncbi:AlkZ-related protein [Butyrivibrio sp. AE3006]|uniref:AlkZ-related protein n=1 Tax=Butyrivibrio sp. AE3006 TaxID=1280673 RepID=UPI0004014DDF|nr:hypothetical protein [Butyrivibrio sp. AE3006]
MENVNGNWIMYGVDWDDPECLRTVQDAINYINEVGFLPLFKNDIPGFSLEERTVPGYWWCGDPKVDPWEWREIIARSGEIAYGKFFEKKAGFISKEWLPYFVNFRRDGYDFDALWDDEKASRKQKKIMDIFETEDEIYTNEVKLRAGFGKGGEKGFEGVVTDLQAKTYLCVKDFRQRKNKKGEYYGWSIAVYAKPETLWGYDFVTSRYGETPEESGKAIEEHIKEIFPIASKSQIAKLLAGSGSSTKSKKARAPKEWIIPANPKYYDIVHAFDNAEEIDWKQGAGIITEDTVYVYVGAPVSAVMYKCTVTETDIPYDYSDKNLTITALMKIKLEKRYPEDSFTFQVLKDKYGINAIRGPRGITDSLSDALK